MSALAGIFGIIPGWIWAATLTLYAVLFVVDLLVVGRRPHIPSTAECVRWQVARQCNQARPGSCFIDRRP